MRTVGNWRPLLVMSAILFTAWQAPDLASGQTSGQKKDEVKKAAPPPLRVPFAQLKPDAVFDLGGSRALAAGGDAVWVSNRAAGTVARIDPKTNKVVATVAVGKEPCGAAVAGLDSLWISLCGLPGVARVDLKTNAVTATIKTTIGGDAQPLATGAGSLWMLTDMKGTLARYDPATNRAVAEAYLSAGSSALAFGQDALWATSTSGNVLTRINPNTNLIVDSMPVGKAPRSVAVGEGAVWTLNQGDGTVSRIDSKTNKVTETIAIGPIGPGGEIAAGEGSVWVSAAGTPLIRIDPRTNHVAQQFTGVGGGAVVVGHGSLWLAASATAIWRIDPKRVEATRPQ
jgi:virginiamycin B lyase